MLFLRCVHCTDKIRQGPGAGGVGWLALALLDGTLLLLSDTGRRTVPPLAMLAPVCLMSSCPGGKVVVLLANGNTRTWDVNNHKVCCPPLHSLSPAALFAERTLHVQHHTNCMLPLVVLYASRSFCSGIHACHVMPPTCSCTRTVRGASRNSLPNHLVSGGPFTIDKVRHAQFSGLLGVLVRI